MTYCLSCRKYTKSKDEKIIKTKNNKFRKQSMCAVCGQNKSLFVSGSGLDIHSLIGYLPRPEAGFTPGKYKYMGPYNPLHKQLEYDKNTGEIIKWHVKPYNKVDEIAAHHDICYDMKKNKNKCDSDMVKSLDEIPYGEMPKWGQTARFIMNAKQKLGLGISEDDWKQQLADELHKPIRRNFAKERVIANYADEIWACDLIDIKQFSRWNKGIKYFLMVIDVFSKYGWIETLKDKKGETVSAAFKSIFKEGRKPKYLWTDKGTEFYNKHLKEVLNKEKITLYSTENEEKSSVVERWNRTIKAKMWKQFTVQNNTVYLKILPEILKKYNNTKHSTTKMTPVEASKKKNRGTVYFHTYGDLRAPPTKPKFKIGDKVRISKYKRKIFDKSYTPNWTEEIFVVDKVEYTNPITYKLKDLNNDEVKGTFYETELQRAKQEIFRIEKVIRKNKKQAYVKWKGYDDKFNSWVPLEDLE